MSILRITEHSQSLTLSDVPPATGLSELCEKLYTVVAAWEALVSGSWSTSAIQSFAVLTRRNAMELPSFGCGALERTLVELVLALDALVLSDAVSAQQIERVDHAMALMRGVMVQRLLASNVAGMALPGEAPVFCAEPCARCSGASACSVLR